MLNVVLISFTLFSIFGKILHVYGAVSCDMGYIEAKTYRYKTNITECVHASSSEEIQHVILNAINASSTGTATSTVRAIGASISYSGLGMLDEYNFETGEKFDNVIVINTTQNMKEIIYLDLTDNTITFESGLRVIEILRYLEARNLTLQYYDGPNYANSVGWFMSGTAARSGIIGNVKGNNSLMQPLANNVIGLKMVIGNGSIVEIKKNGINDYLLPAVLVSFGSLGIVTEVTAKIKPLFYATQYEDEYIYNMNDINTIRDTLENILIPRSYNHSITQFSLSIFEERFFMRSFDYFEPNETHSLNLSNPCWINNDTQFTEQLPCTDIGYKTMHLPPTVGNRRQQTEYHIKAEYLSDAYMSIIQHFYQHKQNQTKLWNDTYKLCLDNDWNIGVSSKWVLGDDIWLSVGYNQTQMAMLGFGFDNEFPYHLFNQWMNGIYNLLNEKFLSVTPIRINWAKISLSHYCWLKESYPKLEEFKLLRKELDPYNLFLNSFTRDKLGICDDNQCCCTNYSCVQSVIDEKITEDGIDWVLIIIIGVSSIGVIIVILLAVCCYRYRSTKLKNKMNHNEMSTLLEAK